MTYVRFFFVNKLEHHYITQAGTFLRHFIEYAPEAFYRVCTLSMSNHAFSVGLHVGFFFYPLFILRRILGHAFDFNIIINFGSEIVV